MSTASIEGGVGRRGLFEGMERLSGMALPFGAAPDGLADAAELSDESREALFGRALALVANAERTEGNDPLVAAACLHEAGRLLDRRLDMPSSAWICHSKALSCASDHRPALAALRRLARRSGDRAVLAKILDSQLDDPSGSLEAGAVLMERAAAAISTGAGGEAADSLRSAAREASGSLVPHLVRLGAAVAADDQEVVESLDRLAAAWPDGEFASVATAVTALMEEQGGRLDEALARLANGEGETVLPSTRWARWHLLSRLGKVEAACEELAVLARDHGGAPLGKALSRLIAAARALDPVASRSDARGGDAEAIEERWEPALVGALVRKDLPAEVRVSELGAASVIDRDLQAAIALGAAAARGPQASAIPAGSREALAVGSPWRQALDGYLGLAARDDDERLVERVASDPAAALVAALATGNPGAADAAIGQMGGPPAEMSWDLGVARAAIRLRLMDDPQAALAALRDLGRPASTVPLPSLVRMHDRSARSLAEVVFAQAEEAGSDAERAWLLAWGASHLEQVDRREAGRLHREALELDPTCGLALAALEREGTDHATMAAVLVAAAESCEEDGRRARNLVRAGIRYLAAGDPDGALEALTRSLELLPADRSIRRSVLRLRRGRGGEAGGLLLGWEGAEEVPVWEMLQLAAVGMELEPSVAARWFKRVLEIRPNDPVASVGFTRATLLGGRRSEESSRLFERLKDAAGPRDEAWVYLRLADIDGRYGGDPSGAALSLMSIAEKLPGHRSTLGRLAIYLARQARREELTQVLAGLATTLSDDRDGAAMANEARRGSPGDVGLLRVAAARDPGSPYALSRLEVATDDEAERIRCLEGLVARAGERVIHVSRLADRLEEAGRTGEALELRRRAIHSAPGSLLDLLGVERIHRELADMEGLEKALVALSEATELQEYRIERILEASRVALDQLEDPALAARHCLEVLRLDPSNDEAFERGRAILEASGDLVLLDRFLSARAQGTHDPHARSLLLRELAEVRIRKGDRAGARETLALALEISPADVPLHRWIAALCREDGLWAEAAEHLTEAARNCAGAPVGVEVFFDLGVLYMDHLERPDLAEKSFVKVLGWNREHFAAMERLSVLYERLGNWGRCVQALEHLVRLAADPAVKVEKTIVMARALETGLGRARDAESVLLEIRRTAPGDVRPVEYLAGMYTRQNDAMALNVLLDQALATNNLALVSRPGDPVLYANIHAILNMKAEDHVASMAVAALRLLGAPVESMIDPVPEEARWNAGARVGQPAVESYLFPTAVPAGLLGTMKAIEEPVARLLGLTGKQMGLGRDSRLDKRHPLMQALSVMTSAFGLREEPAAFVADANEVRIAPGSPHSVIVPRAVAASEDEELAGYVAAYSLMIARSGLSMATLLDEARLSMIIAAVVRLSVSGYALPGMNPAVLEKAAAALRPAIPAKVIAQIQPFAFDCSSALERADLKQNVLAIGNRAGFLGAGSLSGAVRAMTTVGAGRHAGMADLPGIGPLMSFVFSKDHLELRKRMGL